MEPIKLLIADDHKVLLEGLHRMLSDVADIDIVALANDGEEVLAMIKSHTVDIVMMDVQMPNKDGFQTALELGRDFPEVKILVLTMHSEKVYIEKMYRLGVMGYILKSSGKDEILKAIRKIAAGQKFFSDSVTIAMLENKKSDGFAAASSLTKRELEILNLIAEGHNNPAIAAKLFLSLDTIKTHRKNLMKKLKINNTASLVKFAIEKLEQKGKR
ncbi:response regulator transcription factor [soil metagenome]